MKFALIIGGILRCVHKNYEMIFKRIVDYYDCDIIIICQKHFDDDDKRIQRFESKTIYKYLYDKPDPFHYFDPSGCLREISTVAGQWNTYSNLQIFINMNEVSKIIKQEDLDYDYYLMFRTDAFILFDLPPKELFSKIPKDVYGFYGEYFKKIGNSGPHYIHKDYIHSLMTAPYRYVNNFSNNDMLSNRLNINILRKYEYFKNLLQENDNEVLKFFDNLNVVAMQEMLWVFAFEDANIYIKRMNKLPFYYNFDDDEMFSYNYNGYKQVYNSGIHNYRYSEQFNEVNDNLNLYNNGYRWQVIEDKVSLVKST